MNTILDSNSNNKTSRNTASPALSSMQRMCSGREYCEHDIRLKLARFDLSEAEINAIIGKLKEDDFLNEERFALAFVRDKSRLSGWGLRKITYALKNRGVSGSAISIAVSQLDKESERKNLEKILATKARSLKKDDSKDVRKAKLIRFALSRGFGYDITMDVVNQIIS